jgi:hypothetical protein
MSLFVQLPPADYSRTAFDRFRPLRGGFDLDDARAMIWMSQLAYETDAPQTIADIGPFWDFKPIDPVRVQAQHIAPARLSASAKTASWPRSPAPTPRSIAI